MKMPPSPPPQPLFRFYINVSQSFPWPTNSRPSKEATQQWGQSEAISPTLSHLHPDEQHHVIQFHHAADASRSLGSLLLKHLAIMRGLNLPWRRATITQARTLRNGKPFYSPGGLDFNVSHHGNFVVCVASTLPGAKVGIDIVQVDLDKDSRRMGDRGFAGWLESFSDVLSEAEKEQAVDVARRDGMSAGLRMFYTVWACKEAYIKMTGEALMASYLKELAFPGLKVPLEASEEGMWGEAVVSTGVVVNGKVVDGARIELVALGREYIVATAVDRVGDLLPAFETVRISEDGSELECFANGAAAGEAFQTYSLYT